MTIAGAKSIFIRLSLFVALIRLGDAQGFPNNAGIGLSSSSTCRADQFQCRNLQCIGSELLCDGSGDCSDSSDETEYQCSRPELTCPTYAFRCDYGACIDRELRCDGNKDCSADGSDEIGCGGSRGSGSDQSGCIAPPLPINGIYEIRESVDNFENVDPEGYIGQWIDFDSQLVYSCNRGYRIRGKADVYCLRSGRWSRKPVCIEIRCRPLSSTSTTANCTHASGLEEPCSAIIPVLPKTKAQISCRPGYTKEFVLPQSGNVECNDGGKWVPEPVGCKPVCGKADFGQESLNADETMMNIRTFPWHASIYVQGNSSNRNEKVFRCSATVIQSNLLLTAAHCLYEFTTSPDETFNYDTKPSDFLERLFVITGNIHRDYDSPLHDPQFVRKHRIKNVHTDCSFLVNPPETYSDDIALAELEEPLQFTNNLLPACLDMTGFIQQSLEATAYGRVPDSERSPKVPSSQILQPTTVASMYDAQCTILYNATRSPFNIKDNRFCDELNNAKQRMELCADAQFNDGGGLFYGVNNHWYVMGFVSRNISVHTEGGGTSCGDNTALLYTKVSKYASWIQQVTSDLERFKYPPCSRYLAPFHTETATSASTFRMTITTESTNVHRLSSTTGSSCLAPPYPSNGKWKLHRDFCDGDMDCDIAMGVALGGGTQLVYSCDPGYRINRNDYVYCRADGKWSHKPYCYRIVCIPLPHVSRITTCSLFGRLVHCNDLASPNTQAKVSCRQGYRASLLKDAIFKCNNKGKWEPEPTDCVAVCGARSDFHSRSAIQVRITEYTSNFPWHASVYVERNLATGIRKDFLCGATLIATNLLLTAARCVVNKRTRRLMDAKKLFILMGNIHRQYDSPLHDSSYVRSGTVKNVYINCEYNVPGNDYDSDIALLELQETLLSLDQQLLFACLDFSRSNEASLKLGSIGLVLGFGRTVAGVPSYLLQTTTLRLVSQAECGNAGTKPSISSDKFCAGYNNGPANCVADVGSGLYVKVDNLWYVMGIASENPYDNENGNDTCSGNTLKLYTRISDHMNWILDVMFHLERYKSYRPCEF